jgi:hypothetical protein
MSATNLTPTNIEKLKQLLQTSITNPPNTPPWIEAESEIQNILWNVSERGGLKPTRLKYYTSGIYHLMIPMILAEQGKHEDDSLEAAWSILNRGMGINNINEQDNIETVTKGIELGFIELAVRELRFRPLRYGGKLMTFAFLALTNSALYPNFTNRVIASGAPLACLELIREGGDVENPTMLYNLSSAIGTLNNITRFKREYIQGLPGISDAIRPYLPLITREAQDNMVLIGFNAARLLIRIHSKDDSSKILMENPVILEFYPKFMRKLLNIGIANNYYLHRTYWKLAGLALDLSFISMSNTNNKQQLVPIIPLVLEMMVFHHNGDRELLYHGVIFLSQVVQDEVCLVELQKDPALIKNIKNIILSDREHDKEIVSLLADIVGVVLYHQ